MATIAKISPYRQQQRDKAFKQINESADLLAREFRGPDKPSETELAKLEEAFQTLQHLHNRFSRNMRR